MIHAYEFQRRRWLAFLLAALLCLPLFGGPVAEAVRADEANVAEAVNEKDGSSVIDVAFEVRRVSSGVVDQTNVAAAYSSCESCQTVAIAIQIVLVSGTTDTIAPVNVAVALNEDCTTCQTLALAYQFVFGTGDVLEFTKEGRRMLKDIRKELESLGKSGLTVDEIRLRAEDLRLRIQDLLATQLVPRDDEDDDDDEDEQDERDDEEPDQDGKIGLGLRRGRPRPGERRHPRGGGDHARRGSGRGAAAGHHHAGEPGGAPSDHDRAHRAGADGHHSPRGFARAVRAFAALAVCAIFLGGCGASEAEKALDETASNLGEIRSGQMEMKVVVSPNTDGSDIGFELEGPFSLPDEGELPTTDLRYAQIAGESRGEVRFVSNRDGAWVEVDGQAYELPADRVDALIGDGGDGGGPLADLELASWARDAEVVDGPSIPGEETQLVRSESNPSRH